MADLDDQMLRQEVEKADRAKVLLDNPMLKDAYEAIEREILAGMEQTHDKEQILKLHMMLVCNRKMQNILRTYVETGKLAGIQLEKKRLFNLRKVN